MLQTLKLFTIPASIGNGVVTTTPCPPPFMGEQEVFRSSWAELHPARCNSCPYLVAAQQISCVHSYYPNVSRAPTVGSPVVIVGSSKQVDLLAWIGFSSYTLPLRREYSRVMVSQNRGDAMSLTRDLRTPRETNFDEFKEFPSIMCIFYMDTLHWIVQL